MTTNGKLDFLLDALEPFAKVALHDIGEDETDGDLFRPMSRLNRAPPITNGNLRRAYWALRLAGGRKLEGDCWDLAAPDPCQDCLALPNEANELRMLRERLGPRGLEVVEIDGAGHYVNEKVKAEIERLRARVGSAPTPSGADASTPDQSRNG